MSNSLRTNRFLLAPVLTTTLFLVLLLGQNSTVFSQVVINEFSAANYDDVTDNFGEYEDWVELYNTGAAVVDLSGYHLSDKASNLTKWAFPTGITIPAGGYLRVWCSKNDLVTGSHVHTNFKVTQTKASEGFYFSDPSGVLIDSNGILDPNQTNHSWGRTTDGATTWSIFTNPTPNASNTGAKMPYTPLPTATPDAGGYTGSVTVTLATTDPAATIHYTTDGEAPTPADPVYSGPLTFSTTTVLRAVAVNPDPDIPNSFFLNNTYFVDVTHTIPVISIAGEDVDDLLGGSGWGSDPIGSFEYFDKDLNQIDEAVGDYNKHGNDSWAYPQRGIDYITRDQHGYNHGIGDEIFTVKDRKRYQRLIIKAAANDNYPFEDGAHIRDAYVHTLSHFADMRQDERTYEPCIMYVNGQYWGVYELREKVDDPDFTDYYYDQDEDDIDFIKTWGGTWVEYGDDADWYALSNFILTNPMSDPSNYAYVDGLFNLGSLIDYMILNTHIVCSDWLNWNTAWWRGNNPDGDKKKWRYVLWDMDASFGHYINYTGVPTTGPMADPCDPLSLTGVGEDHADIVNALLTNDDFFDDYINRYADLNNYYLSCDYMLGMLDSLTLAIAPEMPGQIARWGGSMLGWETKVQDLRDFILTRCAMIDTGIADCFGVDAFDFVFEVDPPGAGEITVNTLDIPFYSFPATYFSTVDMDLEAEPNSGFVFDYWETINHTVGPSDTDEEVVFNVMTTDTIIAHFKEDVLPTYPFTVIVEPAGAGTVTINTVEPTIYPWSSGFISGTTIDVTANPGSGYVFDYWDMYYQVVNPGPFDPAAFFSIATGDTLVANFRLGTGLDDPAQAGASLNAWPTTTSGQLFLQYDLPEAGDFQLNLYSTTGQLMGVLESGFGAQGSNKLETSLSGLNLAAGMYIIQLETASYQLQERVFYVED